MEEEEECLFGNWEIDRWIDTLRRRIVIIIIIIIIIIIL
jgi:hypothetical protein